jgi:flagellar hook-associated protein 3 FlgL
MDRISTNMPNNNMQFHTRNRQIEMDHVQNQIASQSRITNLRDDPIAAAHATRHMSYQHRLEQFSENLELTSDTLRITKNHMRTSIDIMQEIREIAIQGANSTYAPEDLKKKAVEVDQLLNQLVQTANANNGDGTMVFAADKSLSQAFRPVYGNIEGTGDRVITNMEYIGGVNTKSVEIADGSYMEINLPGNQAFWAENQQIYSGVDASNYVANEESIITIDNVQIKVFPGDNLYSIIDKINNSDASVRARVDPVINSLVLEGTQAHQIWVQDEQGSVLQDLGILRDGNTPPPNNLASGARLFGGSLFDAVIKLRDDLYSGNTLEVGGRALRGIDSGFNNLLTNVADVGARMSRAELANRRIEKEIPDVQARVSREMDVDITEAITELKMLELTHQAALATTARIIRPTLLDFLR